MYIFCIAETSRCLFKKDCGYLRCWLFGRADFLKEQWYRNLKVADWKSKNKELKDTKILQRAALLAALILK